MRKVLMAALAVVTLCVTVSAQAPTTATGQTQAIVGETIFIEVPIPAEEYTEMECVLSLDDSQVQIQSLPKAKGWDIDFKETTLVMVRQKGETADHCLQLKLRILPVPVQTKITLSFGFTANGRNLGTVDYEITVVEPPSGENFLTELWIEGGVFTPQFHPDILQYTVTVPADCRQTKIQAVGAQKSRVEISQTEFSQEGICVATVVVTAENGSQRSYTIQVTREKPMETEPETSFSTEPSAQETQASSKPFPDGMGDKKGSVPGWLVVAGVLAGAALGGAGGILLSQKRNKDR